MHNEATTETATLETVLSEENIREAWLALKANGGAPGVDGRDGSVSVAPKAVAKLKTEVRRLWNARQSLTSAALRSTDTG